MRQPPLVRIIEYDELDSTNNEAKRMIRDSVSQKNKTAALYGTVVTARRQSAGRGRRGKGFLSPGGGSVYASFILKPPKNPAEQRITALAAVAVCEAIESVTPCIPVIKWVNDILVDGKKVCGILAESDPYAVVLGIGVNINLDRTDLPDELKDVAGTLLMDREERASFFRILTEAVFRCLSEGSAKETALLMAAYRKRSLLLGRTVVFTSGEEKRVATATGIADDGALIVQYESGATEELRSGEISLRLAGDGS